MWLIFLCVVLILFAVLKIPSPCEIDTYFDELYTINGNEYVLRQKYYSSNFIMEYVNRFELWQLQGEEEVFVHCFPPGLEGQPVWSKSHGAFFYLRNKVLYKWDFCTEEELQRLGYTLSCILDDYIVCRNDLDMHVLLDFETGEILDEIELNARLIDVQNNGVLFLVHTGNATDALYYYSAETRTLSTIVSGGANIGTAILALDYVWYSDQRGLLIQADINGQIVKERGLSKTANAVVALGKADDYLVYAEREYVDESQGETIITYYQITSDGTRKQIGKWKHLTGLLNNGRIACSDNKILCGFTTTKEIKRFQVQ